MSDPRFGRIPTATQRSGMSRSILYQLAAKHRGLFKKIGSSTIVDLEMLDRILAKMPPAKIASTKKVEAA
jgi:hypothetical protein